MIKIVLLSKKLSHVFTIYSTGLHSSVAFFWGLQFTIKSLKVELLFSLHFVPCHIGLSFLNLRKVVSKYISIYTYPYIQIIAYLFAYKFIQHDYRIMPITWNQWILPCFVCILHISEIESIIHAHEYHSLFAWFGWKKVNILSSLYEKIQRMWMINDIFISVEAYSITRSF